jgi:hypothetical protein
MDGLIGKTKLDQGSKLVVQDGEWIWGAAPVFYYNLPALLGASNQNPAGSQCQLYTSFGVGYLDIGREKTVYGIFGGGMLWESPISWLGVRVDNPGGSDFNSDFALSLGPSFLF